MIMRPTSATPALAALLCLTSTNPLGAQDLVPGILDDHDCAVIEAYDARPGVPSLLEQFRAMVLEGEWCLRVGGPCALPYLRRWDEAFGLFVELGQGIEATAEPVVAALNGLDAGLTFVAESRGVPVAEIVTLGPPPEPGGPAVRVAIASRAELRDLSRRWAAVMPGLDLEGIAEVGLSPDEACWAVASDGVGAPGRLVGGFVFLDADLPADVLLRCGKEEAFNLFVVGDPIGDASLFDDPWGRGDPDPVLGAAFSSRDEVLIRLLYHQALTPGQRSENALAAAASAIHDACG